MFVEGLQRRSFVILGTHGKNDTTPCKRFDVGLKRDISFPHRASLAEDYTFDPVITDDSAPKGIVEIQNETLVRAAALSGNDSCNEVAVYGRRCRVHILFGTEPE